MEGSPNFPLPVEDLCTLPYTWISKAQRLTKSLLVPHFFTDGTKIHKGITAERVILGVSQCMTFSKTSKLGV